MLLEEDTNLRVVGIETGWNGKNVGELWFADAISSFLYFSWHTAKYPESDGFSLLLR